MPVSGRALNSRNQLAIWILAIAFWLVESQTGLNADSTRTDWALANSQRCLILNDDSLSLTESAEKRADEYNLSSSQAFAELCQNVVEGIVSGQNLNVTTLPDISKTVHLPQLISDSVDESMCTDDIYWNYYENCDRWDVQFGNHLPMYNFENSRIKPTADTAWVWSTCTKLQFWKRITARLEFVVVENHQQFIAVNRTHPEVLSTGLSDKDTNEKVSTWNRISAMLELKFPIWKKLARRVRSEQNGSFNIWTYSEWISDWSNRVGFHVDTTTNR